ncbi:hypothetical protein P5673_016886 [Acropora cervicornis]|uniref:Uncharacterized protein n=1 Tax=Acropora cervicornis TaxID=6130 RepID=A0AAD9V4L5_ACRCE|nr:hypothetical protein P5673_016886 [Acropora cervicornis]
MFYFNPANLNNIKRCQLEVLNRWGPLQFSMTLATKRTVGGTMDKKRGTEATGFSWADKLHNTEFYLRKSSQRQNFRWVRKIIQQRCRGERQRQKTNGLMNTKTKALHATHLRDK